MLEGYCDVAVGKQLLDLYDGRPRFFIIWQNDDTVHPIYWSAHRLCRVARSSATAETWSAAETAELPQNFQNLLREVYYKY